MRSFDREMPEELNRVLTDHASDVLLCSTETAVRNLEREGVAGEVHLVGDVMADVSLAFRDIAEERSRVLDELGLEPGSYLVATAHRAGNVDRPERLAAARRAPGRHAAAGRLPGASAHPAPARGGRPDGAPGRRAARATARLPRLPEARPPRSRGAHRLRRRAEGGVSARRPVHHAARHHRVGRDRREPGGTSSSTSTREAALAALERIRPPSGPSCTAAATPPNAFARCLGAPTLSAYEDRSRRARLRRPAARGRVLRGRPRGRPAWTPTRAWSRRCARAARMWRTCRTSRFRRSGRACA